MLLVKQTAMQPAPDSGMDESRPVLAARRMLRILSTESARQTLRPFYRQMLQQLLDQEREEYRGKPAQSMLLVQSVLGRHQTMLTLRRLYQQTIETLDGAVRRRVLHRRYIRQVRQDGEISFLYRYARHERAVPKDLLHLPAARRLPPPAQPPPGPEPEYEPRQTDKEPASPPVNSLHLSASEFQGLVRGVADALGRQSRLTSLRRGGM